jgi:hypothetical protein
MKKKKNQNEGQQGIRQIKKLIENKKQKIREARTRAQNTRSKKKSINFVEIFFCYILYTINLSCNTYI